MKQFFMGILLVSVFMASGLVVAGSVIAFDQFGQDVDTFCSQTTPFQGNCNLCHVSGSFGTMTPEMEAYLAGDLCVFCADEPQCSTGPQCTDVDGDGFFVEGQACGTAVDCDDNNAAVNPGATENCTDGIDNDCNGLTDNQDPGAVGCPVQCTDVDGDGFNVDGTAGCGPQDCNDQDADISPGAAEICGDNVDNDCDGQVDEGCSADCPDADADGYKDAACGGTDCDDAEALVNPGMKEICGNGIDDNCNGMQDDQCEACPGGGAFMIKKARYDFKKGRLDVKGIATVGNSVDLFDAETGELLAADIPIKGSSWKTKLAIDEAPASVLAENDTGCQSEEDVRIKRKKHDDDDDDEKNEQDD